MDIFDREYPEINKLYINYSQTKDFSNNELIKYTERLFDDSIATAALMFKKGDEDRAEDIIIHLYSESINAGFILGFTYALGLIRETNVLKELTQ